MSEAKHTPGPWEVSPTDPCRVNVAMNTLLHPDEPRVADADEQDDDGFHDDWNICQADNDMFSRLHDECVANARLIAAAPDLLAACREALAVVDEAYQATGFIRIAATSEQRMRIEAAIAKATIGEMK